MIDRCHNPRHHAYKHYGARGIFVCDRWRYDFLAFLNDVGPRPEGRIGRRAMYSIERIDNDGGYFPDNVKWATCKEQMANRRNSKR